METSVIIIGAGPSGLTAAYLLAKQNIPVIIIEADPHYVGGIARTVVYKDYCFDIGGHRFFSKSQEVEDFWSEILTPEDLLIRPRSSRIFYKAKFFSYPLNAIEVLSKLGIFESFLCFLSYIKAKLLPVRNPKSFQDWVTNNFGKRLFGMFFKTYTEKVWGMRCDIISADWAAQRIKGLSFWSAMMNAMRWKKSSSNNVIKTLIDSFRYPRKGPGMLWEVCADKIKAMGGKLIQGAYVEKCELQNGLWQVTCRNQLGEKKTITSTDVISSAPLRELVTDYLPPFSYAAKQAAKQLKYRDFLIVVLILKDKQQFNDNWIYIHDPLVDVGRIQNFKSWSEEMVPNPDTCCYGMEYFCFEDDSIWNASDDDLIKKATQELIHIGLAQTEDILDGCVVRQVKAYPVYDEVYKANVNIIREDIEKHFPGLHLMGRNGMHKYNNQDHAMMTAMLSVKNILAGERLFDVWNVNQDAEYIEAGENRRELGVRLVPEIIK